MLQFALGQHMDVTSLRNYDQFTMDIYNAIASTKMAYYTFKMPTYCALLLANKPEGGAFRNMEDIITDMGTLIMMQVGIALATSNPIIPRTGKRSVGHPTRWTDELVRVAGSR